MRNKLFFLFVLFCLSAMTAKSQTYFYNGDFVETDWLFEVGGSVGGMNAFTDIGGRKGPGERFVKDFNIQTTHITGGLFADVFFKNALGFRLEATLGKVSAYDSILKSVASTTQGRYERNLEFSSKIFEVAGLFEIHPMEIFGNYDGFERFPPQVSPYVVFGLGYYHFNPQATLDGGLVNLQPLSTEGQGFAEYPHVKPYKLNQINFPLGFGARYDITPGINLRVELLHRILTTDYLDDASGKYIDPIYFSKYFSGSKLAQALALNDRHIDNPDPHFYSTAHPGGIRADPKHDDAYLTLTIKLGITIGRVKAY